MSAINPNLKERKDHTYGHELKLITHIPSGEQCIECRICKRVWEPRQATIEEIEDALPEEKNGLDGYPPEEVKSMSDRQIGMIQGESMGHNRLLKQIKDILISKKKG